jgi:hypothetical protein
LYFKIVLTGFPNERNVWTDYPEKMQHFEGTFLKDYKVSK